MEYKKVADEVLKNIGGNENVSSVTHCATRLRFILKDESKANDEKVKNLDGVKGLVKRGGQYQVVIGQDVGLVCKQLQKVGVTASEGVAKSKKDKIDMIGNIAAMVAGAKKGEKVKRKVGFKGVKTSIIVAPIEGKTVALCEVNDSVFSTGIMGKGIAIIPEIGRLIAPFDGVVTTLFDTLHAVALTSVEGVELLIHIGLETVKLNGQYFKACIKNGDNIKKGDLLIEFDIKKLKEAGYDIITPVVVTNIEDYTDLILVTEKIVNNYNEVIKVLK